MSVGRARPVWALARIEAALLIRSVLVLAGLLVGGVAVWAFTHRSQPLWWNGGWQIGYGQFILSLTVLVAAHLARSRARRDRVEDLYDSFPCGAGRRTAAHLIAVLGAVPACLVLIAAVAGWFELHGVIGTPDPAVLAGGVLLVVAAGAIGVSLGRWFPHPLAGILGAFVWFVPFAQSNNISGGVTWVFPWVKPSQLNALPGPLTGYPPSAAHAVELAALAVLAGVAALAAGVTMTKPRLWLLAAGALAISTIVVVAAIQLQPIPTADLDRLVSEVAHPGTEQMCTTTQQVRYCLYPGFASLLPSLEGPVNAVLAHVPALHAEPLTVTQTTGLTADDPALTRGHPAEQIAAWQTQLQRAPANVASASAIYVDLGSWPAKGQLADARFDVALGAAEWAVGLPPSTGAVEQTSQCVPVNQAREAIAMWLAILATHLSASHLQGRSGRGAFTPVPVGGNFVVEWNYPGEFAGYVASPGPQTTEAGYLLAEAMTKLPTSRVTDVVESTWQTWSSGQTTDAQLAAALGIPTPVVPDFIARNGPVISPPPGVVLSQPACP